MSSADSRERLESVIQVLKRKRFAFLFLRGAALTAFVSISVLGAVSLLAFINANPYYYAALKIFTSAVLALGLYRFIVRPLFKNEDSDEILSELDYNSPGLGEDALNASELNAAGDREKTRGTSEYLALAHIREVAGRLESIDTSSIFTLRKLKKYTLPLIGAAIVTSILLLFAPQNFLSYLFSTEINPSASHSALKLADIEIKLTYPRYTGAPPESIKGTTGDIKALRGTRVSFKARPLGTFKKGSLVTESGASYPLNKINGKISAEFTVLESGSYMIVGDDGRRTDKIKVTALEDKQPAVSISSSEGNEINAGSDSRIEIFYESRDDFGLSELRLTWETEADRYGKSLGKPEEEAPRNYNDSYTFDLAGVDLGNGETVKLRVEAYDNDTVSGPKRGISNAIIVKLSDARQKHREFMSYTEQLMEELIFLLADEIEVSTSFPTAVSSRKGENGRDYAQKPLSLDSLNLEELLKTQHNLTSAIENASVTLQKALQLMTDDNYSEYTFFIGLSNMDMRIDELLEDRRKLIDSFATVDIPRLERLMQREIAEFEEDILFLDSMIKGEKLRDSLLSGKELLNQYAELSELMKELNESQDENLKAEIQEKLDKLRGLMSELAQKMSAMSGEIQEGFLNRDAFKSMDMQQKLGEIMNQLENGNTEQAMRMLSELEDSLRGMMASLESGLQSFTMSSMSEDMSKVSELISRIEGLEREETSLKDRTENLKKTLLENPGTTGDNIRAFIDKQKQRVKEINKNLSRAKSIVSEKNLQGDEPDGSYLLESLIKKTDELKNWLDAMDVKESHKIARNLEETSMGLVELGDAGVGNLRESRRELANSAGLAGEIREDLDRFINSGENEPRSQGITRRQEEIRKETGELSGDTGNIADEILLSPGIGEKIDEAESHMGKASESLEENELSKAISNQDEAIKSLRQAREEAQGLLQEMQASARGSGSPVPMILGQQQRSRGTQGVDTRYIEIPAARESETGKEFKERILEAMKGGSPEGFSELNKKYYDRIIK